ncbi:MAG TPA: hypothetical protein VE010_16990 [Thermoanaerobaculia bacterium]|nr:hypothetical protein [Thermoanaerobaculia bacterium]
MIASREAAAGLRLLLQARQRERELRNYDPPPYPHLTVVTLANAYAATGQLDLAAETLEEFASEEPSRAAPALLALAHVQSARRDAESTAAAIRRFREVWSTADRTLPHFRAVERLATTGAAEQ